MTLRNFFLIVNQMPFNSVILIENTIFIEHLLSAKCWVLGNAPENRKPYLIFGTQNRS